MILWSKFKNKYNTSNWIEHIAFININYENIHLLKMISRFFGKNKVLSKMGVIYEKYDLGLNRCAYFKMEFTKVQLEHGN